MQRCCRACRWPGALLPPLASPLHRRVRLGRPGRPERLSARLQSDAWRSGALPALLGRGEFRHGLVPPGAGPLRVGPVHPPKGLALKARARQLTVEFPHHEGILGEGGRFCSITWWGRWLARARTAIPMLLEPCRGGILITVGDVVPPLLADECGKEATRVGGAYDTGMFSRGHKGEACTVAFANQSLLVCLLEEGEEPRCITEIFGDEVLQCRRQGGIFVVFLSCVSTPVFP